MVGRNRFDYARGLCLVCSGGQRQRCGQTRALEHSLRQLDNIMDGADDRPLGTHFGEAAQQKLAEAARLFDLAEHRFGQLFAQPVEPNGLVSRGGERPIVHADGEASDFLRLADCAETSARVSAARGFPSVGRGLGAHASDGIAHFGERLVGVGPQSCNRHQADHDDQRQHYRVLHGRRTVFCSEEMFELLTNPGEFELCLLQ